MTPIERLRALGRVHVELHKGRKPAAQVEAEMTTRGLVKRKVADKNGRMVTRWVSPEDAAAMGETPAPTEQPIPAASPPPTRAPAPEKRVTTGGVDVARIGEGRLAITSPMSATLVSKLKSRFAARWDSVHRVWMVDERDEVGVRDLLREVFGTDGTPVPAVDIRVTWGLGNAAVNDSGSELHLNLAGRPIAKAFDRDSGARLHPGVTVVSGGFGSAGSRKNPRIDVEGGTVFIVRGFPESHLEKLREAGVTFEVEGTPQPVERAEVAMARQALLALTPDERAALLKELGA